MSLKQDPFIIIKSTKLLQQRPRRLKATQAKKPQVWTLEEHKQYLKFLQLNMDLFHCEGSNRQKRTFVKMASCIPSRSRTQIKSHHQKMMLKHQTLIGIIQANEEQINKKSMENDCKTPSSVQNKEQMFPDISCFLHDIQDNHVRLQINFKEDELYQKQNGILFWDNESSFRFEQHD